MENLNDLPNLGKELTKQLQQASINSYKNLAVLGIIKILLKIKGSD